MAAYQSNNEYLVNQLVDEIKHNLMDNLKYDILSWNKILTAYGYLKNYDAMWTQYNQMITFIKPDIQSLCIMATIDNREQYQNIALDHALKYIHDWNEIKVNNYGELKGLYRIAVDINHEEMKKLLWEYLKDETNYVDVIANCEINGDIYSFNNLYNKTDDKYVLNLVDELIEKSNHKIDITHHPETQIDDMNKYKMISYHSEKKALAFILSEEDDGDIIKINVNMRMCVDCHNFFCNVSKLYPKKVIQCIDPKMKHIFVSGECSCVK